VSDLLEISGMYRSVETPKFGVVRFSSSMWLNVAETMGRDVDRLRKFGEDRRDFF
jgi:hypothetical protein